MRIRDSLDYLLLSIYIQITSLVTQGSSEINHGSDIPCREGGFCVPIYLCSNDTIITDGSGLIDLRLSEKDCPGELICCQEAVSFDSQLSECQETCVSLSQCLDDVYEDIAIRSSVLDIDKLTCPDDLICCKNVRQPPAINAIKNCQGKCVPVGQCSVGKQDTFGKDIINLRSSDDGCGGDELVCCMETDEVEPNIEVPKVCDGTCVPFYQCTHGKFNSAGEGLINLRSFDDACPGELVCCNTKPMDHIEVPNLCNGTCVPFYQCSNGVFNSEGKGIINLRSVEPSLRSSDETCPGELVCCRSKTEPNIDEPALCVGTCVPFYQCANGTFNSAGEGLINLRSFDDACPGELVCCSSRPESNIEMPKICNGTCVPFYQCANGTFNSAGEGLINLRSFDDACPGELVCCNSKREQISSTCKCLPFNECLDGSGSDGGKALLDLRMSNGDCSKDQVCCFNPKPKDMTTDNSNECKEACVPSYQCMDGTLNMDGKDILDLRFNSCPENLVCCKVRTESIVQIKRICEATCVSLYQCNMAGKRISNSWSYDNCPGNQICCALSTKVEQLETSVEIDSERPTGKGCDRTCVPLAQCQDSPQTMITQLIDIRIGLTHTGCLDGSVCCTNPITFTPDAMKWMDWINDINNMVGVQNVGKVGKCSLNIVRNVESIKEDEIPWLVTVWARHQFSREMQDEYLCVGTLIRTGVVLVPADCIHGESNASLFVKTGNYNLKAKGGFEEFQIIGQMVHPDYDNENNLNNVALLFLTNRLVNKQDEVCMFKPNEQIRNQDCLIAGWNNLDLLNVRNPFAIPKKFNLQIKRTTACRAGYFCTGRSQSIEGCDKLRGSPLICPDQSGYNWKIAGMVVKNNFRCDQNGIPDSLLEVTHLEPWIREQLSPSFVQKPADHKPSRYYLPVKP